MVLLLLPSGPGRRWRAWRCSTWCSRHPNACNRRALCPNQTLGLPAPCCLLDPLDLLLLRSLCCAPPSLPPFPPAPPPLL